MPHYLTDDNSVHLCFFFPWQYLNCFAFELWSLSDYNLMSAEYRVKSYATYCILWWQRNPSVHYASHMIVTTCPFVKEKHENGSICIKENFAQIIEITPVQYWNTTAAVGWCCFLTFPETQRENNSLYWDWKEKSDVVRSLNRYNTLHSWPCVCWLLPSCPSRATGGIVTLSWSEYTLYYTFFK